jgi:5-(carboxyamino)imidazole ribonucleotide synthase
VAVIAARGADGSVQPFPVAETVHKDHICDAVIAPARVAPDIAQQAKDLAGRILEVFEGVGVFGIEMFVTSDGGVLINEIAPRVHNSGHFTLGGCSVSQFEQHMRAIAGESLSEPAMTGSAAAMTNILGDRWAPAEPRGVDKAETLGATVMIYGKHQTKPKRKMGHLTVVADDADEAYAKAKEAQQCISI